MALQTKLQVKSHHFIPSKPMDVLVPGTRKEHRWRNFLEWVSTITWAELNEEEYDSQWGTVLNVIHALEASNVVDRNHLFPTFIKYLKVKKYDAAKIDALRSVSDKLLGFSIVSKAYLLMTAKVDHPKSANTDRWLTAQIKKLLATTPDDTDPGAPKRTRTIVDSKRERCSEIIGELQGLEDERGDVDIVAFLTENNVAREYLGRIVEMFEPRLKELQTALTTKDEELKAAFSCYTRKELKAMVAWYERLLTDVDLYRRSKKRTQKIRVRKDKPREQVVNKLQYMKYSNKLNVNSADPKKLVGSSQVWLYNTKTRKLVMFNASEQEKQLTVRGTTLHGWDPRTSIQKKLRRPEEQLAEFLQMTGRVAMRQFITTIKAKPSPLRGRLNADTLILKVL